MFDDLTYVQVNTVLHELGNGTEDCLVVMLTGEIRGQLVVCPCIEKKKPPYNGASTQTAEVFAAALAAVLAMALY